jgi:sarcosine oxidase subunit beta
MPQPISVVVIGAGIAGLATAVELARRGVGSITVVDKAYPASGSSGLSVGVYNRQYVDADELAIRALGAEIIEGHERDGRIAITHNGYLRIARDASIIPSFEHGVAIQEDAGLPESRLLEPSEIARVVPDMNLDGVVAGLWGAADGYLDGHALCTLYVDDAADLGIAVRLREEVVGHSVRSSGTHVVTTSSGDLEADVVVNAAGAWADSVGDILGRPVPLVPQRHECFVFQLAKPTGYVIPTVMDYVVGDPQPGLNFRGEGDRQLLATLHTNDVIADVGASDPDTYFRGVVGDHVEDMAALLIEALPSLSDMGYYSGWAGLYPLSEDNYPILGPSTAGDGIFFTCGLGGNGIQNGPAAGRITADWILDGRPTCLERATLLGIDRFSPTAEEAR